MTRDTVVDIAYHVNWPGANDGFYLWNTTESQARWGYYSVSGVPDGVVNGVTHIQQSQSWLQSQIRQRKALAAPCTITMTAEAAGADSVHVTGTVTATDSALTNVRLYLALVTDVVNYASAPGGNGERTFPDPFRDLWPSSTGQIITLALGASYTIDAMLHKDATWSADSLSVIGFVQNYSTKWVHQAGWTHVTNAWAMNHTSSDARQMISPVTDEVTYTIHLQNTGNNNDSYTVSVGTVPTGWTQSIEATGVPSDPNSITVPLASHASTDLTYHVNPSSAPGTGHLAVTIQSLGNSGTSGTEAFTLMAGLQILLVDDDGGPNPGPGDFQSFYQNSLQSVANDRVWGYWDMQVSAVDQASLNTVPMVIWFTGSRPNNSSLSAAHQTLIQYYLNNGGKLLLTGQGIAFDLRSSAFLPDVLHANFSGLFQGDHSVTGIAGNPVSDGLNFAISGGDGANNQTRPGVIVPADADATPLWRWQNYGDDTTCAAVGVVTDVYRLVYLSFGFEGIASQDMRNSVMSRVIDWLLNPEAADPRPNLTPAEFTLGQNFPNPFNPETVIPFVLPARADVSLRIYDVLGREVAVLASGIHESGYHTVTWNAANCSSGLYFCKLDATSGTTVYRAVRKLMLMK